MNPSNRYRHGIARILLAIAVGAALLAIAACDRLEGQAAATVSSPPPPPTVLVTHIVIRDVPLVREWVGSLDGSSNARIRAQVSGYLRRQDYRDGSFVKAGDPLFEIEADSYSVALDHAKSELEKARADQVKADLDVKRIEPLVPEQAETQASLDAAVQANLSLKAAVKMQESVVEQAKIDLAHTRILAPIDGIVGIAEAQIGDLVSATTPLATMSTVDPIRAYFPLAEQQYLALGETLKVLEGTPQDQRPDDFDLVLADGRSYAHRGRFAFVDRSIDPKTGTIRGVVLFDNPNNVLRPGQFVKVRWAAETRKDAFLVPDRAVGDLQGKYRVATVTEGNKLAFKYVVPGDRVGSMRLIASGLAADDLVVVEGFQKAAAGAVVSPQPYVDPQAAAADSKSGTK